MKNNELSFNFTDNAATKVKNQIGFTAALNSLSRTRAQEAMRIASTNPELFELANAVIDNGNPAQLFDFLEQTVGNNVYEDVKVLAGATDDELSRLLESRRSDRSKSKAKNPRSSVAVCMNYLGAGYAEMLVRKAWNKPYNETSGGMEVDIADAEALKNKVKSLQSKKSRLSALVNAGAVDRQSDLDEVVAEIERLNSFRDMSRTTTTTVIKNSVDTELIRNALAKVDTTGMSEDEQNQLAELMKKLG